jgi:hypothetical protein
MVHGGENATGLGEPGKQAHLEASRPEKVQARTYIAGSEFDQ